MGEPVSCEGGCHCGAVRFRVRFERYEALQCNCSMCSRKGFLHLIVPPEDFELLGGADDLVTYSFNTHIAKHRFCRIHPFHEPRSHPDQIDVNIHCLDEPPLDRFAVEKFDGRRWEDNVEQIRSSGD
ncbi:MAG: GFA family protein [Candidatus Binatia bacterium]|nr:GFA family protein [Candidatus Binatia bacterium]